MKNYALLTVCLALTACAGTVLSREHREKTIHNVFHGIRSCESGKFVWIADTKNTKQGWKSIKEYACVGSDLANRNPALDNRIYTKEQAKAEAETNPYISNIFYP